MKSQPEKTKGGELFRLVEQDQGWAFVSDAIDDLPDEKVFDIARGASRAEDSQISQEVWTGNRRISMTEKHKLEAREILRGWADEMSTVSWWIDFDVLTIRNLPHELDCDDLVIRIALALSSRDKEIREVLEGLRSSHREPCWCALSHLTETTQFEEDGTHDKGCLTARVLWERVQST